MLFGLLASGADLGTELITSILSAVRLLTLENRQSGAVASRAIMPIAALLSNSNEYVLTQALFILLNLARFGSTYALVRMYVDPHTLTELITGRPSSSSVALLAAQLKFFLGL